MSTKTRNWIIIISILIIAILLIGNSQGWFGKKGNFKEVEVSKITPIDIMETVAATGKIQPEVEVMLSSEVSGEIIELPVKEGQQVEKGDLLVRINPDLIQSALTQAQAGLQNARAQLAQSTASLKNAELNYNRSKTLFEKGVISKSEWDRAVTDYEVAQANKESAYYNVQSAAANVKQTSDNLTRTSIYAPMTGTISKLSVELGERVVGTAQMAGTEIVRVANLSNMEVEVDVNENDIVKVQIGDSTNVEVDAYLKREFKGIVTEIANSAETALSSDQVTNFKVKVRILADSYKDLTEGKPEYFSPFRPGMTATVDIITEKKQNVIGVPISAVVIKTDTSSAKKLGVKETVLDSDEKFECVFVMDGDEAKLRVITTGIQDDSKIEITSGLSDGETVITGPYNTVTKTLKNGDKVTVESSKDKEESEE
ncbi:efflux RND transporter periplasmic adaptor subunit [Aureisphaera sp. CAU 1614]|uniref:Efflux RND transporter periplasmic adaptor subunit n=1 Tax=Halomarinibacterium sedimenti TaxID=2857106 RepID=A0A9X1FQB7_9FLAO|nr:efflux RND transporter periplasmic adaptor subunit [Halomarinibacterium sedimenti]MAL59976.1 efflux transporter periplasmic adaptor subunit [Flavobacteriaceae bacterium]MBW2938651.1 efflux RND transporter periplasmic adaptor subunit [Halomarinibacterium sedimenti]|tara:strand:- start:7792 stop:9075 length:1284 start_codon:yes stop_codon:yes gene_type:complete